MVSDGLYPSPQTPGVSAVAEAVGYTPGVLPLGLFHALGQVGPCCPQALLVPSSKGSVPSFQQPVDLLRQPWLLSCSNSDGLSASPSQDEASIWVGCLLLIDVLINFMKRLTPVVVLGSGTDVKSHKQYGCKFPR